MTGPLVSVAVPVPLYHCFDYRLEQGLTIPEGTRVRVPFGRRHVVGIALAPASAEAGRAYRSVGAVLDPQPLLPPPILDLCRWAASYYQHPLGETLATALPAPLRQGEPAELKQGRALRLTASGRAALDTLPARARAQRALLATLAKRAQSREELPRHSPVTLRKALAAGWLEYFVPAAGPAEPLETPPALTAAQQAALAVLDAGPGPSTGLGTGFSVSLLEGVTGSGKTELYLRRAAQVIAGGGQVLVLAPEIGLTPQLAARFAQRFGAGVARFHSAMADGDRAQTWLRARAGLAPVVVGTRSAVFVPLPKLGLIVVDEEHDGSYKQQDGLRYSARDLAIVRARQAGVPVILGSATPALETLHNARHGRYRHAVLRERVHAVAPPRVQLLDVRSRSLTQGLSEPLVAAIGRHLAAGGQALLFINRRGYAPVLLCHACGWQAPCRHCDARLALHRARGRLICHHCGAQSAIPAACGSCSSRELIPVGQGTERIEEALRAAFPGRRIERFDSDRMRRRGALEKLLADVGSGAIHILVGTQLLAKGHDFAQLSLVGIIDVDQALYGSDFRALERVGQLVTQVAGRAGRKGQGAEVILQTHEPRHPALRTLLAGGYPAFCDWLLDQRRASGLPPFSHLALLRAESPRPAAAQEFLAAARTRLDPAPGVSALGPVPAPMEKIAGRHRAQLLLQTRSRQTLQQALANWVPRLDDLPAARHVRWSIDVDPQDLF